jgi:hypothetical protein
MGMEGINWEGVNAEAKEIFSIIREAQNVLYRMIDDFSDELSVYWASGNAVDFGKKFFECYKQLISYTDTKLSELEGYIQRAANIYSTTFNVSNGFQKNGSGWLENTWNIFTHNVVITGDAIAGNIGEFKTSINGITGINKSGAQTALDKFKANLSTFLDELSSSLTDRDIALFDVQQEQKEAYNVCVSDMKKEINDRIYAVLELVTEGINTEIDNARLAKQQTVNTFSA